MTDAQTAMKTETTSYAAREVRFNGCDFAYAGQMANGREPFATIRMQTWSPICSLNMHVQRDDAAWSALSDEAFAVEIYNALARAAADLLNAGRSL